MKLHKKIIIKGRIELLTGLHIGDSKENVEIGGVDAPVVRRKDDNQPYIPGSSLKGKIRSLLEIAEGVNADSSFRRYPNGCVIPYLFGSAGDDGLPSRIIFRDSYLTDEWAKKLFKSEFTDMPFTELKFENVINRIKGTAEHPRQIERIPAGAQFDVEMIINIITREGDEQEALENEKNFLSLLKKGIKLLEDDYLGGSGSRGYGQVKFHINWDSIEKKDIKSYSEV